MADLAGFDTDAAAAAVLMGVAAALAIGAVARPLPRLAPRVRPYNSGNRVRLGRPADPDGPQQTPAFPGGAFAAVLGPMLLSAARLLGQLVDRDSDEELLVRLRNAAYQSELPDDERLQRYRVERLGYVAGAWATAVAVGWIAGSMFLLVAGSVAAVIGGLALPRARIDAAVQRRWQDLLVDSARLAVRQRLASVDGRPQLSVPKSDRSRRTIDLDRRTLEALKLHREEQVLDRRRWGAAWHELDLIAAREDGMWIHPDWLSEMFRRHVKKAGLPAIRLHDLRHTHATLLLQAGVNPKIVSERLGHHSVAFTLDTYAHVLPGMQAAAAESLAEAVFGGQEGTVNGGSSGPEEGETEGDDRATA